MYRLNLLELDGIAVTDSKDGVNIVGWLAVVGRSVAGAGTSLLRLEFIAKDVVVVVVAGGGSADVVTAHLLGHSLAESLGNLLVVGPAVYLGYLSTLLVGYLIAYLLCHSVTLLLRYIHPLL